MADHSGGSSIFLRWGCQLPSWCYFAIFCRKLNLDPGKHVPGSPLGSANGSVPPLPLPPPLAVEYTVKVCPWCGVGLLRLFFLCCGVINKLTLLLILAAPVKRKGARGEVCFPETPLLCALFYLKGPAPCCYWLAVTCLSAVVCLSLKAVLSRLVTVL